MKYDVVGLGNSLMQIVVHIEESILTKYNLKKGGMHLVQDKEIQELHKEISAQSLELEPSGDCANTMMALTAMGGSAIYIGKIGHDHLGEQYKNYLVKENVHTHLPNTNSAGTGMTISLVTPDKERTMVTSLGAALHLRKEDILSDAIKSSKYFYLSSYIIEDEKLYEASNYAMSLAKENGTKIAFDVADASTFKRCEERIKTLIQDKVSVLFCNETESKELTGKDPEESSKELSKKVDIAVVKIGSEGSIIASEDKIYKIPAFKVDTVDTTGAGDVYAAGFLLGLTRNKTLNECGRYGSVAGAQIVQQLGSRLTPDNKLKLLQNLLR
jgi:sugar/nucleoside kinase (ribokinase family)